MQSLKKNKGIPNMLKSAECRYLVKVLYVKDDVLYFDLM